MTFGVIGSSFFWKCVKLLAEQLWQIWQGYAPPFFTICEKPGGGGADNRPPPAVRGLSAWRFCTALLLLFRYLRCFYPAFLSVFCLFELLNKHGDDDDEDDDANAMHEVPQVGGRVLLRSPPPPPPSPPARMQMTRGRAAAVSLLRIPVRSNARLASPADRRRLLPLLASPLANIFLPSGKSKQT